MSSPTNSAAPTRCRSAMRKSCIWTPSDSERVAHALDARHACCRSEREPNDGACRETEREAGRCAGRRGRLECDRADGRQRDEPICNGSNGSDELRAGDDENGDHEREPELGEPPPRPEDPPRPGANRHRRDDRGGSRARRRRSQPTARSRTNAHRRCNSESATIAHARTSAPRRATRQSAGAHPEHRDHRLLDILIFGRGRLGDHRSQTDDERSDCKKHTIIVRRLLRPGLAA